MTMYGVCVYERLDDWSWDFLGYEKVFLTRDKALEYAVNQTKESAYTRYYHVDSMSEKMIYASRLEDLIEP